MVIRKNADDLSDWVDRANHLYGRYGVSIAYRPAILRFPSGAVIRTGHLKDDQAYTKYQGHEYQRILIEELTQIPNEKLYLQLISSCRSTDPNLKPQIFCTTNPGGIGHGWVKRRFVDPAPPYKVFRDPISERTRIFIPAKVDDNPVLMDADPNYVRGLDALKTTDEELWKAWRLGSWDTFAGQFFREFRRDLHVCPPFTPKKDAIKIGGVDWGRTKPFAFMGSIVKVEQMEDGTKFHRVITYKEVYGVEKTPKEWAEEIIRVEPSIGNFSSVECDPAMFTKGQDMSISIADQMKKAFESQGRQVLLRPGSNDRIGGWANLHNWLSLAPDGLPYWMITESCVNLIKELPELVHDETRVEDVDTEGMDHAADAIRYSLKRLKWIDGGVGKVMSSISPHQNGKIEKAYQPNMDLDAWSVAKQSIRDPKA